jgi:hypothetical protein
LTLLLTSLPSPLSIRTPTFHYDVGALLHQARTIRFGTRDWQALIGLLKDQIPIWRRYTDIILVMMIRGTQ